MPQCHQFVQNAWKKDLCSNCFKSKEEHSAAGDGRSRYLATMIPVMTTTQATKGILKDGQKPSRHPKGTRVIFPAEESQVIGYGGDEAVLSDDEDDVDDVAPTPVHVEETPSDGEHEREMQKLTRTNTDFNTVAANLLGVTNGEPKRSFAQLMLGKPLTDAAGRKKTLLVTVQPFGGAEPGDSPAPVANTRKASNITRLTTETQDKNDVQGVKKGGDESAGEVLLKSVVRNGVDKMGERGDVIKLDVKINETKYVEKNDNTNEIIRSIVDKQSADEKNLTVKSEVQENSIIKEDVLMKSVLRDVEIVNNKSDMSLSLNENKIQDDLTSMKENGDCDEKTSKIPLIKSRVHSEKTKAVIRTAAFNGRADLETKIDDVLPKPAMRKSYDLNNKNSEYIIQKEKSSVVLNLIIKDKNNSNNNELNDSEKISKSGKIAYNTEINGNHELHELDDKCLIEQTVAKSMVLTNGVSLELKEQPKMVVSKPPEMSYESQRQEERESSGDKMSPIVESKNSLNISKQIYLPDEAADKTNTAKSSMSDSVDESVRKLPTNIYRKLPVLDEPIILKEVSKSFSTPPVPKVTLVEPTTIQSVSTDVRKIDGEPALILPTESAKMEVYSGTKLVVEGPPMSEKNSDSVFNIEESRELAGEPDGRADSDELSEPPALPSSPPPSMDPRPSFLHGLALGIKKPLGDKPKIPIKSSKVFQATRKAFQQLTPHSEKPSVKFDLPEASQQQPDNPSDPLRTPQKRRAPKPPPTPVEDPNASIFARNPSASSKSYSPICREKEKRERASSCSPKSRTVSENVDTSEVVSTLPCPEPAPRRNLSLSVENLPTGSPPSDNEKEGKKKSHNRSKFSIRKFLRMGSSKELEDKLGPVPKMEEVVLFSPAPKLRPEIIHPLELNGQEVEVVRGDGSNARRSLEDTSSTSSFGSNEHRDSTTEASSDSFSSSHSPNGSSGRPHKPPPPPRNQSLDAWGRSLDKPARPPPPKSAELLRKQLQPPGQGMQAVLPSHSVYANLDLVAGEVRSGITPSKPQRSASIRDMVVDGPKRKFSAPIQGPDDGTYELVEIRHHDKKSTFLPNPSEGVYECVRNSSPESDVSAKTGRYAGAHRRSEGSVETTADYAKFRGQFQRTASLPYCGADNETDIYAPYSFYSNEDGLEDEGDYSTANGHTWKTNRLRLRKGRSIVHKNLEDNYGAVIIANHEALAQVLEQVNQIPAVPLPLRGLASMTNLRWADFTITTDCPVIHAGRRVFHSAQWSGNNVTLCTAGDQTRLPNRSGTYTLAPLTEFSDLVPASCLQKESINSTELIQASVAVLLHLRVDTIKSYGMSLLAKAESSADTQHKEASFILLQLINGLKNLQAQGIEESPLNLSSFVLCREEKDIHPRLYVLQSLGLGNGRSVDEEKGSLCQCAAEALKELIPNTTTFTMLVKETLAKERAVSLTQVKSLLEFSLWGPGDVALGEKAVRDRELALQRWLDLERATVLHGLVRTRVELTSFEECHLLFLVRTSAKMMCEASFLLESYRNQQ